LQNLDVPIEVSSVVVDPVVLFRYSQFFSQVDTVDICEMGEESGDGLASRHKFTVLWLWNRLIVFLDITPDVPIEVSSVVVNPAVLFRYSQFFSGRRC
jgi:hypothetical protein